VQGHSHFRLMTSPDLIVRVIAELAIFAAAKATGAAHVYAPAAE